VTVNRNTLDWSISGREALYTGGLPETNTFSAVCQDYLEVSPSLTI